jgi:hypothetical protein
MGFMDEVRIWGRALNAMDIKGYHLALTGHPKGLPPGLDLKAHFAFHSGGKWRLDTDPGSVGNGQYLWHMNVRNEATGNPSLLLKDDMWSKEDNLFTPSPPPPPPVPPPPTPPLPRAPPPAKYSEPNGTSSLAFDGVASFGEIPHHKRSVNGTNNSMTFEAGRCKVNSVDP